MSKPGIDGREVTLQRGPSEAPCPTRRAAGHMSNRWPRETLVRRRRDSAWGGGVNVQTHALAGEVLACSNRI